MRINMNKLKLLVASLFSATMLFGAVPALAQPAYFGATSKEESCQALKDLSPDGGSCDKPSGSSVKHLMRVAINMLSVVAGIVAVIMLIVSGFKYVTSQGDAAQISNSKKTIIYAIVGLVLVAFAQFIVRFVLKESLKA